MIQIIPAIIPTNLDEIQKKLELVNGLVSKVQLDFVDGKYAPPITWPFNIEEKPERLPFAEEIILEADLFIKNPEDFIEEFIKLGIKSFVIHIDSTNYLDKCLHNIKSKGFKVGLGIKPSMGSEVLEKYLDKVDFVQFMGNDMVGYNGVELDRSVLKKISDFHASHPMVLIQVDIGVNTETARELVLAGTTSLVSGSAVWGGNDIKKNIESLRGI